MEVKAESMLIDTVFQKGKYIIPEYQREYDWTEENITEFINDINEIEEKDRYFIGHIVLEGDFNGNEFKVIDGQQRITTITILLCVIRDLFVEKGFQNLADGLNENYIFSKDRDNNKFVVLENKMPYPLLHKYVQNLPLDKEDIKPIKNGEIKIKKAYNSFYEEFKDFDEKELKIIRDKVLNLEVIFVSVKDEVDAFTIFETLNAKGKDLTPMDLIKNQVFKNYPKEPHLDEPNDSWKEINNNIKDNTLRFLNNFWSSRYKKVSDRKIYKEFTKVKNMDYKIFVKDLLLDSNLFKLIISPKKSDWKKDEFDIFTSLNAISIFNVKVANAIILSVLREYKLNNISLAYCKKALKSVEKFHFLNNAICSFRSSGLDTMYSKISRDLFVAKDRHQKHNCIDTMIKNLEEKKPTLEHLKANFDDKLYYSEEEQKQKKLVKYVLEKIEYSKHISAVDFLNTSIEHIYPENAKESEWKEKFSKIQIKNLANLTLLDSNLNSKIGNKRFDLKKSIVLGESNLVATKLIFSTYNKWDIEELNKRKEDLYSLLYEEIWK